jgi:hypothetical protein
MVEKNTRNRSTISTDTFSQSFQIRINSEKRSTLLKYQAENFLIWRKQELKYQGKFLLDHTFTEGLPDRWHMADFKVEGDYDITCEVTSDWEQLNQKTQEKGFELCGRVLKPRVNIHLRSLACDFKLKVRMIGDSSLFLISRNSGFIEETSPVIKISRDTSLKGLFAMFGTIDTSSNRFYFMKQVQIPEDTKLQPAEKNYKDLEITFNDNGDSRLHLSVSSFGKYCPISQFFTFCDTFIPYFEKSKFLLAASGESVLLKKISIQQRERNHNKIHERPQDCCCLAF